MRATALLLVVLLPLGCGDSVTGPGGSGTLLITASTSGVDLPEDVYWVRLAHTTNGFATEFVLMPSGIAYDIGPGPYLVELRGLPANCVSAEANPRHVTVVPGDTVSVEFHVTCGPAGVIAFTVHTCGASPDPDGYTLWLDGIAVADLGPDDQWVVPAVLGVHQIALSGVAPNCSVVVAESGRVVVGRDTVAATLGVFCDLDQLERVVFTEVTNESWVEGGWLPGHREFRSRITVATAAGECRTPIINGYGGADAPDVSADGHAIAFAWSGPGFGPNLLYVVNADGSGLASLGGVTLGAPTLSPDGNWIAYLCPATDVAGLCLVRKDGTGLRTLTTSAHPSSQVTWSPDGTRLAFAGTGEEGPQRVNVVNADGSDEHPVSTGDGLQPSWSPDGLLIAFARWDSTPPGAGLYLVEPDGSDERLLLQGTVAGHAWSPDGRTLALVAALEPDSFRLYLMDADGSNLRTLTSAEPFRLPDDPPAWSPDGAWILFTRFNANVEPAWEAEHMWITDVGGGQMWDLGPGRSPRWLPH